MTDQRNKGRKCETCDYWEQNGEFSEIGCKGTCHRYAPRDPNWEYGNAFPKVHNNNWCGEYMPVDDDVKAEMEEADD